MSTDEGQLTAAEARTLREEARLAFDAGEAAERRIVELRAELAALARESALQAAALARVEGLCAEADEGEESRVDVDLLRGALRMGI